MYNAKAPFDERGLRYSTLQMELAVPVAALVLAALLAALTGLLGLLTRLLAAALLLLAGFLLTALVRILRILIHRWLPKAPPRFTTQNIQ